MLLSCYMKKYNIKTDGFKFEDMEYDDSSDSDGEIASPSSPPTKRKRSTDNKANAAADKKPGSKRSTRGTKRHRN